MNDTLSKNNRSWVMSQVPSKDTSIEKKVRSLLHREGYRFRTHDKLLPGKPDIVLRKYKTCIFVNGCFWHQHKGCKKSNPPRSNVEFWKAKFERNKKRDKKNYKLLRSLEWKVLVIWECEIKEPERIKKKFVKFLTNANPR